jgi:hypothetical protein
MTFDEVQAYITEHHQLPLDIMIPDLSVKGLCGIATHSMDDEGITTMPCLAVLRECECCQTIHAQLIPLPKDVLDSLIPQLIHIRTEVFGNE